MRPNLLLNPIEKLFQVVISETLYRFIWGTGVPHTIGIFDCVIFINKD